MLKPDWFELPLERQLTLTQINQEIDKSTNIDDMKKNLKALLRQNAMFERMIGEMLRETLTKEMDAVLKKSKIENKDS